MLVDGWKPISDGREGSSHCKGTRGELLKHSSSPWWHTQAGRSTQSAKDQVLCVMWVIHLIGSSGVHRDLLTETQALPESWLAPSPVTEWCKTYHWPIGSVWFMVPPFKTLDYSGGHPSVPWFRNRHSSYGHLVARNVTSLKNIAFKVPECCIVSRLTAIGTYKLQSNWRKTISRQILHSFTPLTQENSAYSSEQTILGVMMDQIVHSAILCHQYNSCMLWKHNEMHITDSSNVI